MQLPTTAQARRAFWQEKLGLARAAYADELARMEQREALYEGTRQVQADPNTRQTPGKLSSNVRNIVYELIESQVDATSPAFRLRRWRWRSRSPHRPSRADRQNGLPQEWGRPRGADPHRQQRGNPAAG